MTEPQPKELHDEDLEDEGEDEEDREDTQVTALLSGMKEVVFEQVACTQDLGQKADRVSRMARRPRSVQNLRAVTVVPADPHVE